ncbi:Ligand-binding SRPBCC domain-containing protein [Chryseolinea serpens]|uniref:Ligand-binding SRPBCC domain-containing protein n=1 Tax=Chryseolinea serpens TaxID=947013 RepID=A0A1M5XUB2_9BACT|nr:SRPBCC family protein [Chryseolinea serpens]SHI02843.1 Ligand-binding SRPBCC domain-containing protein [Chryseolinea serpens]
MYKLTFKQFLPINRQQAWDFFSSPKNLADITPKRLNFKILSMSGGNKMHIGQIIRYKITVLPFVRMYWETEIIEVLESESFVDIQKKGPYAYWAHKHSFKEVNGGVEMIDELEYAVPFGLIGRLANYLFVAQEVRGIFEYRFNILSQYFTKA